MTLLDTPEFRKAVEAVMDGALPGLRGHNRAISLPLFEKGLLAALPSIRKALAEELRAEGSKRPLSSYRKAWYDAADFIEEGK